MKKNILTINLLFIFFLFCVSLAAKPLKMSALPAVVNVGVGETYTSLTGSGGLFSAINAQGLAANTLVYITSDLTETGTVALTGAGLNGFSLTIQPSAATLFTISGSVSATAMIRLSGVAQVAIDGRFGGSGQYLRLLNSYTPATSCGPVVELSGGSSNSVLCNCLIESNIAATTQGIVHIGSGTNTSFYLIANDIRDDAAAGTMPYQAIYSSSSNNIIFVQNNNIYNFDRYGLNLYAAADGCEITDNHFFNSLAPAASQTSIRIYSGGGHLVSGNHIGGSAANCGGTAWTNSGNGLAFIGIEVNTISAGVVSVQGNEVANINLTGSSTTNYVDFYGIKITEGNAEIGTLIGNTIGHATTADNIRHNGRKNSSVRGISLGGSGTVTAANNLISNVSSLRTGTSITVVGIDAIGTGIKTIQNNIIAKVKSSSTCTASGSPAVAGIACNLVGAGHLVEGNTVSALAANPGGAAASAAGIMAFDADGTCSGTISRNRIYDIRNASTNELALLLGIHLYLGNWTLTNNQIALSNAGSTLALRLYGVYDDTGGGNTTILYYNSIYLSGNATSGAQNTYAYARTYDSNNILKNNLLYNARTGTGAAAAMGDGAITPAQNWSSDYNLLVVPDSGLRTVVIGGAKSFNTWKTIYSNDLHSWCTPTNTLPAANLFADAANGDLSILPNKPECWYVNGKGVQIPGLSADFGSVSAGRPVSLGQGGPDIGADDFVPTSTPPLCTQSGSHAPGGTEIFQFAGRTIAAITWLTGTLPTVEARYYSGEDPPSLPATAPRTLNSYTHIQATGGGSFTYDITLLYDDALLYSVTAENALMLAKHSSGWLSYSGTSTTDPTANTITCTGLGNFSSFTGTQDPLGTLGGLWWGEILGEKTSASAGWLTWRALNADGVKGWAAELSIDGAFFRYAEGIIERNGDFYSATLEDCAGARYCRVAASYPDGSREYSPTIALADLRPADVKIWPNPASEQLFLQLPPGPEAVEVLLFDLGGNEIRRSQLSASGSLPLSDLPTGTYLLHLRGRIQYSKLIQKL